MGQENMKKLLKLMMLVGMMMLGDLQAAAQDEMQDSDNQSMQNLEWYLPIRAIEPQNQFNIELSDMNIGAMDEDLPLRNVDLSIDARDLNVEKAATFDTLYQIEASLVGLTVEERFQEFQRVFDNIQNKERLCIFREPSKIWSSLKASQQERERLVEQLKQDEQLCSMMLSPDDYLVWKRLIAQTIVNKPEAFAEIVQQYRDVLPHKNVESWPFFEPKNYFEYQKPTGYTLGNLITVRDESIKECDNAIQEMRDEIIENQGYMLK